MNRASQAVFGTLLAFAALLTVLSLAGLLVKALSDTGGSNALDAHVLDWMIDRRSDGLTDVMRAVTTLGGTLVLMPLTVVGVVVLSVMRRYWLAGYLATLVIGASLLSATTKAIVGRARPPTMSAWRASGTRPSRPVTPPRPLRPISRWRSSSAS